VVASGDAAAWAGGAVTGDVLAGDGEAVALAAGAVLGAVRSEVGRVRVWPPRAAALPGSGSGDLAQTG